MRTAWLIALLLATQPNYRDSVEQWRVQREADLRSPDGWLSLTGLFWLKEGANTAGSTPGSEVQLPDGLPRDAGVFIRNKQSVQWRAKGQPPRTITTDKSGSPDIIEIGRVRLHVIERGTKLAVRMKDSESPYRKNFRGLNWFPVDARWNVRARFHPKPRMILFDAQAGDKQEMSSPGYVEWTWRGRTLQLTPVTEDNRLFFVFRDKTAGRSTYAAARFLYAEPPEDGFVQLDFNKAYNPPCVFTPYSTCPLPPPENRLPIAIPAGEKMYIER